MPVIGKNISPSNKRKEGSYRPKDQSSDKKILEIIPTKIPRVSEQGIGVSRFGKKSPLWLNFKTIFAIFKLFI